MQQRRTGVQGFVDLQERRALVPRDWKLFKIEVFHRLFLSHNRGDGFPAKSGFAFCKSGLIGEAGNHAETISTGDVFSRKNRVYARMRFDVGAKVSEGETCSVIGAANDAEEQRISWHLVSPKNFDAVSLALAVEANQTLSNGGTGRCDRCRDGLRVHGQDRGKNL